MIVGASSSTALSAGADRANGLAVGDDGGLTAGGISALGVPTRTGTTGAGAARGAGGRALPLSGGVGAALGVRASGADVGATGAGSTAGGARIRPGAGGTVGFTTWVGFDDKLTGSPRIVRGAGVAGDATRGGMTGSGVFGAVGIAECAEGGSGLGVAAPTGTDRDETTASDRSGAAIVGSDSAAAGFLVTGADSSVPCVGADGGSAAETAGSGDLRVRGARAFGSDATACAPSEATSPGSLSGGTGLVFTLRRRTGFAAAG